MNLTVDYEASGLGASLDIGSAADTIAVGVGCGDPMPCDCGLSAVAGACRFQFVPYGYGSAVAFVDITFITTLLLAAEAERLTQARGRRFKRRLPATPLPFSP